MFIIIKNSNDITLFKSIQRKYFVGQTEFLIIGQNTNAWGGLINPCNSGVNLFVNVITISNFSDASYTAQIWFNSKPPGKGTLSDNVVAANTAVSPLPVPKVKLKFVQSVAGIPTGGVNAFDRIVPPKATLVSEEDGKFIIPPGGSYIIFLQGPDSKIIKSKIAFGWWEEKI